jgi:hypothetical protein
VFCSFLFESQAVSLSQTTSRDVDMPAYKIAEMLLKKLDMFNANYGCTELLWVP